MPDKFEDKLLSWIESNALFEGVGRVLLAVSGGADSAAMVHAMVRLKQAGRLSCEFVIGHVNHGLRGAASDGDQVFVEQLGQSLGIDVVSAGVDVRRVAAEQKLSIETAGREQRLKTLVKMAAENGCGCIATAHHKDDLAETMVHRLMRGTGFRGLCGIWPKSEVYEAVLVRPMLEVRRAEIIQYCGDRDIQWRQDASNADVRFTRNRIRRRLLPELEAESEHLIERLADLSRAARRFCTQAEKEAGDALGDAILKAGSDGVVLRKSALVHCRPWVFYELIRNVLVLLDVGLRGCTQRHFTAIHDLMDQAAGGLSLPGPIRVFAKGDQLGFRREVEETGFPSSPVLLEMGQTVSFGPWRICCQMVETDAKGLREFMRGKDAFVEWFDADKVVGPLEIRLRRAGDRLWPIGGKGPKKAGRFLIDAQLDADLKNRTFVIKDDEKVLWVAPVRMSELAKVDSKTTQILEIRVLQNKPTGMYF